MSEEKMMDGLQPPAEEDSLVLIVDWSGKLRPGAQLSPKFRLCGKLSSIPPAVHFKLDERLERGAWNDSPTAEQENESEWSFLELFNLRPKETAEGDATYMLSLEAVYYERDKNRTVPVCFKTTIQLTVPGNANREIVVDAADGALINTHNLDLGNFDRIEIRGRGDALVNLNRGIVGKPLYDESGSTEKNVSKFQLRRVRNSADSTVSYRTRRLTLSAHFDRMIKRYYLWACHDITVGRGEESSEQLTPQAELVYRFYREEEEDDSPARFLSRFISRRHFALKWENAGVGVVDLRSNMGTAIQTPGTTPPVRLDKVKSSATISWETLHSGDVRIETAKIAEMELTPFSIAYSEKLERTLQRSGLLLDEATDDLWYFGKRNNIDVLKITRKPDLLVKQNRDAILKALKRPEQKELFEKNAKRWKGETSWKKDPLALEEEYFFVLRAIAVGNNKKTCPICVESRFDVASVHALFFFCGDHFGLANLNENAIAWTAPDGRSGALFLNDPPLFLEPGMTIEIGKIPFVVEE